MKLAINYRSVCLYAFLIVIGMLGLAAYLQFVKGIHPCPLCLLQRFVLMILGVIFFLGWLLPVKRRGQIIIGITSLFFSIVGIIFAGRQVWIQHLPTANQSANCEVSLEYLLHVLPFHEIIARVFSGAADGCGAVEWTFLSFSMASWTLAAFIGFGLFAILLTRAALFASGTASPEL